MRDQDRYNLSLRLGIAICLVTMPSQMNHGIWVTIVKEGRWRTLGRDIEVPLKQVSVLSGEVTHSGWKDVVRITFQLVDFLITLLSTNALRDEAHDLC